MAHALVVGAGLAGARCCDRLRAAGFAGRITLIGAEAEAPYDRPPLTKDPEADVDLRAAMGLDVWSAADEVRLGAPARGLRVALGGEGGGVAVDLAQGTVHADAVIVATGATPVLPAGWAGPGVHVLHTRAEARRFWADAAGRVVVVGGGWIGCEASAVAASRGAQVTVVEAGRQLLPGQVPAQVAGRVGEWLADVGVGVHLGSRVVAVEPGDDGVVVDLGDRVLPGRVVLVAVGVRPATAWLAGSGAACGDDGAILVDPWGRCCLPGVFAVGDAAARWSPRAGTHLPGGHWTEALTAPETVAVAVHAWLAGDRSPAAWLADPGPLAPDPVPYVFSEIAGHTLQVIGDASGPGDILWQEDPGGWSAHLVDPEGLVRAVCSQGRPRDVARARRAMLAEPAGWPQARAVVGG